MASDGRRYQAFISFAAEDETLAEAVEAALTSTGLDAFRTPLRKGRRGKSSESTTRVGPASRARRAISRMRDGVGWLSDGELDERLARALDDSAILVVLWSRNHRGSTWCRREIDYFHRCHPTRPVLVVPTDGQPIPENLRAHRERWVEAGSIDQIPGKVARLVESIVEVAEPDDTRGAHRASLRDEGPVVARHVEADKLGLRTLFTWPRRWATALSPTGDITVFDALWGRLGLPVGASAALARTAGRTLILLVILVGIGMLPVALMDLSRLLHHQFVVVTIVVVGGALLALTFGIGSALVASAWSAGLGLLVSMLWWFLVGNDDGGVPGAVAAGALLGIAAAYRTATSPVEGVDTPHAPRALLWMTGALLVGFVLGMALMSVGHFTPIPRAQWLLGRSIEVRGVFAWMLDPSMLTPEAWQQLLIEGRLDGGWESIRASWRAGVGAVAGALVGAGFSVAGWQSTARNYRRREGRWRGLPAMVLGTALASALGGALGVLPPVAPVSPAEGIVIGCFVAVFATSLFSFPVLVLGSRTTESTRNTLRISGLLLVLSVGHPQLAQFTNIADQVSTIAVVAIGTLVTTFIVTTAMLPPREDQPTGPRRAAAISVALHFLLVVLAVVSSHLAALRAASSSHEDEPVLDNPPIVVGVDIRSGGSGPEPEASAGEPEPVSPASDSEASPDPDPSSEVSHNDDKTEQPQHQVDQELENKPPPHASRQEWYEWLDTQPHPLSKQALAAARASGIPGLLTGYYEYLREKREAARRARSERELEGARSAWVAQHFGGKGWSEGGELSGLGWVRRVSNGEYEVLIAPGFHLEVSASFEGSLPASLEIQGETKLSKPGGSWRSSVAGTEGRVIRLRGHGKHPCPLREGSTSNKRQIGFEDAGDNDCNEPDVRLELVDHGELPAG